VSDIVLPLSGVRVLDMATLTPGKYCSYLLADLGATVTRVERPIRAAADDTGPGDEDRVLNRNKRSIILDLKSAPGAEALAQLCAQSDVLIEANRPGVADRLGYGYRALSESNPALVYCALTAFGQTGPYRDRPAYDLILMGMSGVWHALLGGREPPAAPGLFLADAVTGLTAAFGVVTACLQATRTGKGAYLDLSMLEATAALLATSHGVARRQEGHGKQVAGPARIPGSTPGYRCYQAQDGAYVVLGAIRPASWSALRELVGADALGADPSATGHEGAGAIAALTHVFATAPAAAWVARLSALDIDCGQLVGPGEVHDDPQLRAREMVTSGVTGLGEAELSFLSSPLAPGFARAVTRPAPAPGQDTEAILQELGIGAQGAKS
jgi:alpha-methylacyl-CoA racemase